MNFGTIFCLETAVFNPLLLLVPSARAHFMTAQNDLTLGPRLGSCDVKTK